MIKVEGQNLWRGGVKIGYVSQNSIFDDAGKKLGYCSANNIYDANGRRIAWLDGNNIYFSDSSPKIRIEDNEQVVIGGSFSSAINAAVRLFLGD